MKSVVFFTGSKWCDRVIKEGCFLSYLAESVIMFLVFFEFLVLVSIVIGVAYIVRTFLIAPGQKVAQDNAALTTNALKQAEVDYLEIRQTWIGFYNLNNTQPFYADAMDDIKIPEVAHFQRLMVRMNQQYSDLKTNVQLDETFVGKVIALKQSFNDAVIAAKKNSLS